MKIFNSATDRHEYYVISFYLGVFGSGEKTGMGCLKRSSKNSKDSLTRKLRQEVEYSEALKPTATGGQEAKVQVTKYNSYYELFLKRAPILLQTFETASDAVLGFFTEVEGTHDAAANNDKIKACIIWLESE